jgi:hypothetical protein
MSGPWIPRQGIEILNHTATQRVEMDVPHELEKVRLLLHQNRLVAILKEVTRSSVPKVEGGRVPRKESAHHLRERNPTRPHQEVKMVGHQTPGINRHPRWPHQVAYTANKIFAIPVITEKRPALNPPSHYMMERPFGIQPWTTRHKPSPPQAT